MNARVFTFNEFDESAQAILAPWATIITGPVKDTPEWYQEAATFDAMIKHRYSYNSGYCGRN